MFKFESPALVTSTLVLGMLASGTAWGLSPANQEGGVRIQIEETIFEIDASGQSRPIDHRVIDVFDLRFEDQYGSQDRSEDGWDYGATYFEIPPEEGGYLNHNIYLYMRTGGVQTVSDGYHNGGVPGSKFKQTAMLMVRNGNRVRVRVMHAVAPRPPGGDEELETRVRTRGIQKQVQAFLDRGL